MSIVVKTENKNNNNKADNVDSLGLAYLRCDINDIKITDVKHCLCVDHTDEEVVFRFSRKNVSGWRIISYTVDRISGLGMIRYEPETYPALTDLLNSLVKQQSLAAAA